MRARENLLGLNFGPKWRPRSRFVMRSTDHLNSGPGSKWGISDSVDCRKIPSNSCRLRENYRGLCMDPGNRASRWFSLKIAR
mgnify:CR=1 FL=1